MNAIITQRHFKFEVKRCVQNFCGQNEVKNQNKYIQTVLVITTVILANIHKFTYIRNCTLSSYCDKKN